MNTLFVMVGLPGSGKSHWIEGHLPNASVLSPDTYLDRVYGYAFSQERVAAAWNWCLERLDHVLGDDELDGVHLVWDATMTTRSMRAPCVQAARQAGWRVVAVYMDTPVALCRQRNAARPQHRQVPEPVMEHMQCKLTVPTVGEGFHRVFRIAGGPEGDDT